jgi:hypothetical protein
VAKAKIQLTLLVFATVAVAAYGVHRAMSGQDVAVSYALAAAAAAASIWGLATTAFAQMRGRRALLSTPAIAGFVLAVICLLFVRNSRPVLLMFASINIVLSGMNLLRAVRYDRAKQSGPDEPGDRDAARRL